MNAQLSTGRSDCPCAGAGKPRYYCWISASDCPHGLSPRFTEGTDTQASWQEKADQWHAVTLDATTFHSTSPYWNVNADGSCSIELNPGPLPQPRGIWQRIRRLTRRMKQVIARV